MQKTEKQLPSTVKICEALLVYTNSELCASTLTKMIDPSNPTPLLMLDYDLLVPIASQVRVDVKKLLSQNSINSELAYLSSYHISQLDSLLSGTLVDLFCNIYFAVLFVQANL